MQCTYAVYNVHSQCTVYLVLDGYPKHCVTLCTLTVDTVYTYSVYSVHLPCMQYTVYCVLV